MMEDSPCESFEPLDLPHVSTHGDEEPKSSKLITLESPNFTIEPMSSPVLASVTCNFPQFPKVYSREKAISEQKQVQESNSDLGNEITEWKDAMREEISALEKNKTWEIVERPKGKNIVDCKWIFTLKYKADGSLERHKARLNPVVIGCPLQLATLQYEVENAFLHGDLDEEIYMNIPSGFEGNTESGYKQSQGDYTLFVKYSAARGVIALLVHVDDIIVTGSDERENHEVKQRLATEFEIKELGKLNLYPMDPKYKLGEAKEEPVVDKRMYQRLVGRLIYLAHTWLDIAYSMSVISQFMHDPREPHLQAAYRVLHYLKSNPGKGILFKKNNTLALEAYTDADYAKFLSGSKINYRVLYFSWRYLVT
ncbi:Retrovirus-related Pol polyprotein from transposon RE1 [Vitis vinifera]|uniref:Retrovirus-related Pol polyprotein from transposon RE1 n=1 Tax=Vitis vinifera TaxID=29760 RepID=A0A438DRS8_VITVI|nr:Retrovirus-related Pol polyprotein from transposon RE1 [Vitis vinifera]